MTNALRIGVDLGGTKIEAIALYDNGAILARRRLLTPSGDYNGTLCTVIDLVTGIESELGTHGSVGIGTPGAVSRASGLIKNSNSTCLNGKPLHQDLEQALARPVRIANDADCFALSEAIDGAAAGADVVFGVILGTGVGGGIVAHGRLLAGPNAIAGEWGHNPLPWPQQHEWPGPPCYCGRTGCIETLLSGPGMTRDHFALTGDSLTPDAISVFAATGDEVCEATLARYEDRLARALASVINILDPDVIVLGGGVSNLSRLYSNVPRLWGSYVFSDRVDTRLVPALHGDSSGVRGAAWLWGR
ncbi:MAG: ROK family protein [Gammaproteobacteria bacterium]